MDFSNSSPPARTLSQEEIDDQFSRNSAHQNGRLFEPNDESDPLQPVHPRSCCNPKKRSIGPLQTDMQHSEMEPTKQSTHTRYYFKIADIEIIGDLSAFSMAKAKGLVKSDDTGKKKSFLSTFVFITVQYLYVHIQKLTRVQNNVFLTLGLCDQFFPPHDITNFQKYYKLIVSELEKKGAKNILVLLPPPYFRNDTIIDLTFYNQIREIINQSKSTNLYVLNLDHLFFSFKDSKFGILGNKEDQDGAKFINIDIRTESFHILPNSRNFYLDKHIANMIGHELKNFASFLSSQEGCSNQAQIQVSELTFKKRQVFMHLKLSVGTTQVLALVDTGASVGVMRKDFCQKLQKEQPGHIRLRRLTRPQQIKVADGAVVEINELIMVKFYITQNIQIFTYFVVSPVLIQEVIIGMDLLRSYKAVIDCDTNDLTLKLSKTRSITVKATPFLEEVDILPIESIDLTPFKQEDEGMLYTDDHNLVAVIDYLQPIRSEIMARIDRAVHDCILTTSQANQVLTIIIPLAQVFGPHTGRYNWGAIELELTVTERWKVKRYGTPIIYLEAIRKAIKEMLRSGLIVVGDSPWVHPIVIVPKTDGSIRLCIDASALNLMLTPMHHDTKKIENILFEPSTGPFFSAFDFAQGFHQIPISAKTSKLLAFQFEGVTYLPKTLPFGTSVSSSVFNKVVRSVIYRGKPFTEPFGQDEQEVVSDKFVRTYVDDVLIQTPTFEAHLEQMEQVFKNIISSGMTLSLKKSSIFTKSIKFLGHVISDGRITKNFNKQKFFTEFEKQYLDSNKILKFSSKRVVQRLVGFLNWFSRFLPNFAQDIEPFLELIRSPPPLKPTEVHTNAYFSLKEKFLQDFALHQIRLDRPFHIKIVAEESWASGCIFQRGNGGELNIISMLNFRYPDSAMNKTPDTRKYYALFYTLTRYKDLLVSSRILVDRELGGIMKKYREAVEVNGVIAKWFITINSFTVDATEQSDKEFSDITKFVTGFNASELGELSIKSDQEAVQVMLSLTEPNESSCEGLEQVSVVQGPHLKFLAPEAIEQLETALENIEMHQGQDPFCQKVIEKLQSPEIENKFTLANGILYKVTSDEFKLLVIPQHIINDLVRYLHITYCHPGALRTTLLVKRQFYYRGIDSLVTTLVAGCIDCKHNKISTTAIEPTYQSTIASKVGTLFVDHFGPFPIKRGGVQAVFVAMDRLSGYVRYEPVRALTTVATIAAMNRVLAKFQEMGIKIHTVISDNAPCFRAVKWKEALQNREIRVKYVSPHNANANAVERQMRELGTGLRLRLNADGQEANSHRHWDSELKYLQDSSNSIPKKHGYSPNQILGMADLSRDPAQVFPIHCIDPRQVAQEKLIAITTYWDKVDHNNIKVCKNNLQFSYDKDGWVTIYVDGASKPSQNKAHPLSAYSIWFQSRHRANCAKVLEPGMSNNQTELIAVIMALRKAWEYQIQKVKIVSDSNYIISLWEEGELSPQNPKISTYENRELFQLLIKMIARFDQDKLDISHIHGHTVDFGNLEADFWAGHVLNEYQSYQELVEEGAETEMRENIMKLVAVYQKFENELVQHKQATSGKSLAKFLVGDIVALKNHALSQAGYGLTKKFFPKYTGQFVVTGDLGPNCYKLQNSEREEQVITANIRQLILLNREPNKSS